MPAHYALSEFTICIAAIWGAVRLWRSGQALGALGVALFGIAAAIGVVRILTAEIETLALAHRMVSQAGGTFGLTLVVSEIANLRRGWQPPRWAVLVCAGAGAVIAGVSAAFGGIVFLTLIGLGVAALTIRASGQDRVVTALGFGLMAPNVLLVRQSAFLEPATSWHAFHLITAIWLIAAAAALAGPAQRLTRADDPNS